MLEKLKANLPLLSIGIIILGLTKQILFYKLYSFPILDFVSIQEIVLYVIEDLLIALPIISIFLFIEILFENWRKSKPRLRHPSDRKKRRNFLWLFGLYLIFACSYLIYIGITYQDLILVTLIIAAILYLLSFFLIAIFQNHSIIGHLSEKYYGVVSYIGLIFIITFIRAANERDSIKYGKYENTFIKTESKSYTIDRDTLYIGKTQNYIFIHIDSANKTEIIPIESLLEFTLQTNH